MDIYLQGLTMGLAYVAPIGLQNLFVINTALTQPRKRVYATALIVIFFDVTLGLACFFGIGAVMSASVWLEMIILAVGSLIVIWIGIGLIRSKEESLEGGKDVNVPIIKVITTACVVTWFNPQALIDGSMMLGAFKATLPEGTDLFFVGGFASASVIWFLTISTVISLFSAKFTPKTLRVINVVCGAVVIFYGAAAPEFHRPGDWLISLRPSRRLACCNYLTKKPAFPLSFDGNAGFWPTNILTAENSKHQIGRNACGKTSYSVAQYGVPCEFTKIQAVHHGHVSTQIAAPAHAH